MQIHNANFQSTQLTSPLFVPTDKDNFFVWFSNIWKKDEKYFQKILNLKKNSLPSSRTILKCACVLFEFSWVQFGRPSYCNFGRKKRANKNMLVSNDIILKLKMLFRFHNAIALLML